MPGNLFGKHAQRALHGWPRREAEKFHDPVMDLHMGVEWIGPILTPHGGDDGGADAVVRAVPPVRSPGW